MIFEAEDADIFHALENFNDHSMVVEEVMNFRKVFLFLLEAVIRVKHICSLELKQFVIIDSNMTLVAHRLLLVVLLRQNLWSVVLLVFLDLESISDVFHRCVVDRSNL